MQNEESKRNVRFEKLENETQSIKAMQLLTFTGGALFGVLTAFAFKR